MNPLLLLLASGDALFLGMVASAMVLVPEDWISASWPRIFLRVVGIFGAGLVVFSSTPISSAAYGIWIVLFLIAFLLTSFPVFSSSRRFFVGGFVLFSLLLCLREAPYHFSPAIHVSAHSPVYVVGDSISAGIGSPERTWPSVLEDLSALRVTNLAVAGATASSAQPQVAEIPHGDALVFVEIGGNDMLHALPAAQFGEDLDALLSKIADGNRQVVMFELPLIPLCGPYGLVQRMIAKKHNVLLIPKKNLIRVIGADGDTLDGLHLSQQGHDALAKSVYRLLKIK
jgi:acyl-CoA thioesterase-1